MAEFNFTARLERLLKKIFDEQLDAILICKPENVFYVSGFNGDSTILFISKNFRKLITDGRYNEQAESQAKNFEIIKHTEGLFPKVADEIKNSAVKKIGFEGNFFTFDAYADLKEKIPDVELKSVEINSLRQIKDAAEIFCIRRACEIADKSFAEILKFIKAGVREFEVAAKLEYIMRKFGSERAAFDTIVASGVRGSLPHGRATEKIIERGDFVTLDFGAVFNGYHSDMTRTICVGAASNRQREIYNAVLDAQIYGLEVIKAGLGGKAIDEKVRERIKNLGFGENFVHGLGHSLGLEIHEEPRLSPRSTCESLEVNMVVTDEPGIYIPNFGGVRIEDTVLVTANGAEPLTKSPKNLLEI
ncbi:MAG: aminopeptidase P family protein [Selenomonadaceae bacterium]|nr:aminopeptidase P family protein [Selenomonadaceae bacterium]